MGGTWPTGSVPLDTWSALQRQRTAWGKCSRWRPGLHYRPDGGRRAVNVPYCKRGCEDCFLQGERRSSIRSNLPPLKKNSHTKKRLFSLVFTKGVMVLLFCLKQKVVWFCQYSISRLWKIFFCTLTQVNLPQWNLLYQNVSRGHPGDSSYLPTAVTCLICVFFWGMFSDGIKFLYTLA